MKNNFYFILKSVLRIFFKTVSTYVDTALQSVQKYELFIYRLIDQNIKFEVIWPKMAQIFLRFFQKNLNYKVPHNFII